jgi:hypothetical protein
MSSERLTVRGVDGEFIAKDYAEPGNRQQVTPVHQGASKRPVVQQKSVKVLGPQNASRRYNRVEGKAKAKTPSITTAPTVSEQPPGYRISISNFPDPFGETRICPSPLITASARSKAPAPYVLVIPTTFIPPARAA